MISKKLALEILNLGLSTGADYAEIFYEDSFAYSLSIDNGKVETSTTNNNNGVGIRLLKGLQSVYGYTSDLSKKGLLALTTNLAVSFSGKRILEVKNLKVKKYKKLSPINIDYDAVSKEDKVNLIKEGLKEIEGFDPRIVRVIGAWNDTHRNVTIFNSKGDIVKSNDQFGRAIYMVTGADANGIETTFEGPGAQMDISYFKNKVNLKKLAREAAETCIKMLGAKECPSGIMPVVIAGGSGGVLFHEACGHALEASSVSKNLSCFAGKLGQKIASPILTAIDDSTIPHAWGSIDYDDEGVKGEKRVLIKNGVLKEYMVDMFNGRRMNAAPNGACRRQSFRYEPTSRMSNTYIDKGPNKVEEIISATKLGLYAKSFSGGSVDPTTGEFNFTASEAYIIRDGKIAEPVKGAILIGKGEEILPKIDMIADDLALSEGICGASSGGVRVTTGQPTLRISSITVGGRGGELK
ncbi:MAG: TldD/PmbA family protein [Erysipelotrichaceae bacterium]|nr:TldD/PmbA family protein [Erysipelotrichaceae bacterium]